MALLPSIARPQRRKSSRIPPLSLDVPLASQARRRRRAGRTRWLGAAALVIASLAASTADAGAAPAYVGRVATERAAPLLPTSSATLSASRQVAAGDAVIVAIKLSTSLIGGISANDAAGNSYRVEIDQGDGLSLG